MEKLLIVIAITAITWLIDWAGINLPIISQQGFVRWMMESSSVTLFPHPAFIAAVAIISLIAVEIFIPDNDKKDQPSSLSKDKKKAMHPHVPNEFLSKEPHHLTVGTYGNLPKKYVNIHFFQSPDHMLIIGSPGSQKTTTLLNMLLYNFNFSEETEEGGDDDAVE